MFVDEHFCEHASLASWPASVSRISSWSLPTMLILDKIHESDPRYLDVQT